MGSLQASLIEEHLEEAAALWSRRDAVATSPIYQLRHLAELDARVEAHVDGLRVAGDEVHQIAKGLLHGADAGETFALARLAYVSGDTAALQQLSEIACASPELARGLISALGWSFSPGISPYLQRILESDSAEQRYVAVAACAVCRINGEWLQKALCDTSPLVLARTCRTVGELGRVDLLPHLVAQFTSQDESVRFWANWSAALLGNFGAIHELKSFITSPGHAKKMLGIALRRLPVSTAAQWLEEFSQDEKSMRLVIEGAGIIGDPVFIEGLLKAMQVPALARVAGESFTMITGMDITQKDWIVPALIPEEEEPVLDIDSYLPWPDVAAITVWWAQHRSGFQTGVRHLLGRPPTQEHAQHVLRTGTQRQRAAAAVELALIHPGMPLFETRAPGFVQQKLLG